MGPYVRLHFLPKYQDIFENDYLQHEVKHNDQWELELHPDLSKLVTCSLTSQYCMLQSVHRTVPYCIIPVRQLAATGTDSCLTAQVGNTVCYTTGMYVVASY